MCILTVSKVSGVIVVILQANTRKFTWIPDKQRRDALAVCPKWIVLASTDTSPTTTGVLIAKAGRPPVLKAVEQLGVETPVVQRASW